MGPHHPRPGAASGASTRPSSSPGPWPATSASPSAAACAASPGAHQTGRSADERRRGPRFAAPGGVPSTVLVVDDVCTTGATLSAAAAALRSGRGAHRSRPGPRPDTGPQGASVDSTFPWAFSTSFSVPAKARRSGPSRPWYPRSTRSSRRWKPSPTTRSPARPSSSASSWPTAPTSTTSWSRPSPSCARPPAATIGQRHYDVQLMGGAALHFGWVAEMKTGEGKTLVSTLPVYLNALAGDGVHLITVNDYLATRDAETDGPHPQRLGLTVGLVIPGAVRRRPQARAVRLRHHLRHEQRVRLRLPARQHGHEPGRAGAAGPQLLHRRRGRLDPHRRGPHPAHHLGPGRRRGEALLPVRLHRPGPQARRALRRRRGEAHRRPHRRGRRGRREGPRRREHVRRGPAEPRPPVPGRAPGQGAVQARQGLRRPAGRGEDRRRVHRPHPRRAPLVRGPPPGRRGQGGREDQGGEPDPRHGHPPELLPHVRQARRHDGHGRDRGRRVRQHLRPPGRADPHPPADDPPRPGRPHLQDRGRQVRRGGRRHRRALRGRPAGARRHHLGGEVREAVPVPRQAGHPPRGAERQAALP